MSFGLVRYVCEDGVFSQYHRAWSTGWHLGGGVVLMLWGVHEWVGLWTTWWVKVWLGYSLRGRCCMVW